MVNFKAYESYESSLHTNFTKSHTPRGKFGDVMTGDHKILNEGGESRNNHRYAIVV